MRVRQSKIVNKLYKDHIHVDVSCFFVDFFFVLIFALFFLDWLIRGRAILTYSTHGDDKSEHAQLPVQVHK